MSFLEALCDVLLGLWLRARERMNKKIALPLVDSLEQSENDGAGDEYSRDSAHALLYKSHRSKAPRIIIICFLAALLLAYLGLALYFNYHFSFNSVINSVDCAFMTPLEVEKQIEEQVKDYKIKLTTRGGTAEHIAGSAVDLAYVPDGQVQRFLAEQNGFLWPLHFFTKPEERATAASVSVDKMKLKSLVNTFSFMDPDKMEDPVDAYIAHAESGHHIKAEELGTTIHRPTAHAAILEAVLATAETLDLDEAECYVKPEVFSDSSELKDLLKTYETYVPFSITYEMGDEVVVLDGGTTINWITVGKTKPGKLKRAAVVAWVDEFADAHDTVGTKRTFENSKGKTKTVEGGTYGWEIDREAEVDAIFKALKKHSADVRAPILKSEAASWTGLDWGTTYVEVDIKKQHMWYFVDGKLTFDTDVVTGNPNKGYDTPFGVYDVWDKKPNVTLLGRIMANGKREYRSPVSFWMPVTYEGVGFHDATWQAAFGGERYLWAGSHGCINMSYDDAAEFYDMVEVGCPVVIHD